ncbi:ABC transporter ATP-binding protein [Vulcanimicrobium alpinum]|uniref:ABC transporter ATP-binding protein n=1 Tax=Vulcanimicrobium alpinum TaxID=3016050 RepID=A0AAN1XT12_UNVUL|nr:ABC transporter ATP-binding protein [Vulcanimicrobium alpinum]BDE04795.1 ABC transporter ATP-binding protein [Vulcanimicrobium alpinum]
MSDVVLEGTALTKRFGGLVAVSEVHVAVQRGEILGLIGPNGAGKSTLFRLIAGIMKPTAGRVAFRGRDITNRPAHDVVVAGVAATHQIVRPFREMSVLENVMVGAFFGHRPRPRGVHRAREAAMEALTVCDLADRAASPARALTLGGQKWLEVARALATRPEVLLLDEVLAGLNPTETDRTLELIRAINERGTTIVIVEHNLRAVRGLCSRIVALVQGRKVVEGAPEAVLADERVVTAYLGPHHG